MFSYQQFGCPSREVRARRISSKNKAEVSLHTVYVLSLLPIKPIFLYCFVVYTRLVSRFNAPLSFLTQKNIPAVEVKCYVLVSTSLYTHTDSMCTKQWWGSIASSWRSYFIFTIIYKDFGTLVIAFWENYLKQNTNDVLFSYTSDVFLSFLVMCIWILLVNFFVVGTIYMLVLLWNLTRQVRNNDSVK